MTERACKAHGNAGRRRGLTDDDIGAGTDEEPGEEGQVEGHVGDVSSHRTRAVAQDGGTAHLDEAGALPCVSANALGSLGFLGFSGVAGDGGRQA